MSMQFLHSRLSNNADTAWINAKHQRPLATVFCCQGLYIEKYKNFCYNRFTELFETKNLRQELSQEGGNVSFIDC